MIDDLGTDWGFVRKLTDAIFKHSLLDRSAAKELAIHISDELFVHAETSDIQGADYLGGVQISRWVTGWFKR